jgi:hypothetical protein
MTAMKGVRKKKQKPQQKKKAYPQRQDHQVQKFNFRLEYYTDF